MAEGPSSQPLFRDLTADDPDPEVTEVESLCMECGENGTTRLFLTKIPFYREVILSSFSCPHCNHSDNHIQPGGPIQPRGVEIQLKVTSCRDLNRKVVRSDHASVAIPELDFEAEAHSEQKGEITTVEGVLERAKTGLNHGQAVRRIVDPESAEKIDGFLERLQEATSGQMKFTFVLRDITGNSWIENPFAPEKDPAVQSVQFARTIEEDGRLGIFRNNGAVTTVAKEDEIEDLHAEVLSFPTNCPHCNAPCQTNMKLTDVPHFKEVIIMATNCDTCGHRTNEVKPGGSIEETGVRIKLKVTSTSDWNRDVLVSETCRIHIPELDFEGGGASLGGRFTTLEGLVIGIKENLVGDNPMVVGDSADADTKARLDDFAKEIDKAVSNGKGISVVLDDPAGNSYLQNLYTPAEDPEMEVVHYQRSHEQNEELGLNHLCTEGYQS